MGRFWRLVGAAVLALFGLFVLAQEEDDPVKEAEKQKKQLGAERRYSAQRPVCRTG